MSTLPGWLLPSVLNRLQTMHQGWSLLQTAKQLRPSHLLSHHITDEDRLARMPLACMMQRSPALKSSRTSQKPTAHTAGKTDKDWHQ